jgi:hypothetical protein
LARAGHLGGRAGVRFLCPFADERETTDRHLRRPDRRSGEADAVAEWDFSGRTAKAIWLSISMTHDHVIIWFNDDRSPIVRENVVRTNAGHVTEEILEELGAE